MPFEKGLLQRQPRKMKKLIKWFFTEQMKNDFGGILKPSSLRILSSATYRRYVLHKGVKK